MHGLSYLYPRSGCAASVKTAPTDFVVDEVLGFEPDGSGEHVFVLVQKTNANTSYIARRLAHACAVRERDISFSGMKDRVAVTTQWFSVHLPGLEAPDLEPLNSDELKIISAQRHSRKLRRGTHTSNRFVITLRHCVGDRKNWQERLQTIAEQGFPNYFGEQRFGQEMRNVDAARRMFGQTAKRQKRDRNRGIYLSAARSWVFNQVLSARIAQRTYDKLFVGDVLNLDGSNSVFCVEQIDDAIQSRLQSGDVHLTGPLWGKGAGLLGHERHAWEQSCVVDNEDLCSGLALSKLKPSRRSLRCFASELSWEWPENKSLRLSFTLNAGCFATVLLRELADCTMVNSSGGSSQ
ncbi:MAG: tRNA pseudouridine(13) synthase TruD [Pseudomonadota bacterium]